MYPSLKTPSCSKLSEESVIQISKEKGLISELCVSRKEELQPQGIRDLGENTGLSTGGGKGTFINLNKISVDKVTPAEMG